MEFSKPAKNQLSEFSSRSSSANQQNTHNIISKNRKTIRGTIQYPFISLFLFFSSFFIVVVLGAIFHCVKTKNCFNTLIQFWYVLMVLFGLLLLLLFLFSLLLLYFLATNLLKPKLSGYIELRDAKYKIDDVVFHVPPRFGVLGEEVHKAREWDGYVCLGNESTKINIHIYKIKTAPEGFRLSWTQYYFFCSFFRFFFLGGITHLHWKRLDMEWTFYLNINTIWILYILLA